MKRFILVMAVLMAAAGGATAETHPDISLRCVTGMATTSFLLRTQGTDVVLTTVHHNGTGYMPIHEGIVVPNDMGFLSDKAKVLMQMGDRNEFRFPRARCKIFGPGLLTCSGGERKRFGDLEMEALSFVTGKVTQRDSGQSTDFVRVALSVNVIGHPPVMDIAMYYTESECRFQF